MTGDPGADSSLLGPWHHLDLEVLAGEELPRGRVQPLIIVLPEGGLSRRDQQRCDELAGRPLASQDLPAATPTAHDAGEGVTYVAPSESAARQGAATAAALPRDSPVHVYLPVSGRTRVRQFVLGLLRGCYRIRREGPPPQVKLLLPRAAAATPARQGAIIGRWVLRARDWANEPSNRKDPAWLAEQAASLAGGNLDVTVWHDAELRRRGFGGVLAVGAGSASPPNVTIMRYRGGGDRHVVLVGKGITFDSGGLSLKPPTAMPLMKTDMTGAAAVMGTVAAVRDLELPITVTAVLACAENMPSGSAMRPGDVVRHFGGRTTEVLNTDAEGRLVLADCLAMAAAQLQPDFLVDVASLTGSATVGLGRQHAALYCDDRLLLRGLRRAASLGADPVWPMPLVPEYSSAIASDVADSANTNTDSHTSAGSITAALFLQPFAGGRRWAHLDIAGAARAESDRSDTRKGATGFGVSLLTCWLAALAGSRW